MATALLITGFEPFGPWRVNSSWEGAVRAAPALQDLAAGGDRIALERLPVDHGAAANAMRAAIAAHRPKAVLATGLAAGAALRLERQARRPLGPHVVAPTPALDGWPAGPDVRLGRWRWSDARRALATLGAPAIFSSNAGGYVCETTYRAALDAARGEAEAAARPAAFLHVPPLSAVWPAERIAAAIAAMAAPALR